jgi:maltose alpha-D-glucosyltransferase/alpha-amylase
MIIDFEGEPARKISERTIKRSPFRDVAGMLRSFDYASNSVLINLMGGIVLREELPVLRMWAQFWCQWTSVRFLKAYLAMLTQATFIPQSRQEIQTLLDIFTLEKAVYELGYELNNRPTWVGVPLQGIMRILGSG